jgi:hypothetical protein
MYDYFITTYSKMDYSIYLSNFQHTYDYKAQLLGNKLAHIIKVNKLNEYVVFAILTYNGF